MTNKFQRWKNCMKAYPFSEKRLAKWQPPYIVQPKYNGFRCRAIPLVTGPKGNEYLMLSSEENVFYSVPHLNDALSNIGLKCELDGELYCHGMSLEDINSISSRTVNLHQHYKDLEYHIFDMVIEEPQMRRLVLIDGLKNLHPKIKVSPFWLCENLDEVKKIYDKIIKLGYEGIIVRHFTGAYETKRSTMLMKFKPKKHDSYKIIGWNEELTMEGAPKSRIGSLTMSSQAGDEFSVSAGLDFNEKARLWEIRDSLAGKTAIVHYQHLSNRRVPTGAFNVEVVEDE